MVLKMDKIIEIFNCGDCPHLYYHEYGYSYCNLEDKVVGEDELIPDWCPLSNKEN